MCAEQVNALELKQQALRAELKSWEHSFAEDNGGRKAGKDDIKRNSEIAAKYKEYNRLRHNKLDPANDQAASPQKSRKRKSETTTQYPIAQHPAELDPYDVPQPLLVTPRAVRTWIGPTPQKNGQVLGLFDTLSPYSIRVGTPSRSQANQPDASVAQLTQTPSRKRISAEMEQTDIHRATPSSSSKRRRLDAERTPSTQRHQALMAITPLSNRLNRPTQPILDQTPAFLKRYSDPSIFTGTENELGKDITYSPPRIRLPRKPAGRSLSQLVQSLRQQEDEKLDEELALMREIETGEAPLPPKLLIQDSQIPDLPLGADGEHDLSDEGTNTEHNGPVRLWKKKGQKRTTRKANIGVNRAKWKPEAQWNVNHGDDETGVPESQATGVHADKTSSGQSGKLDVTEKTNTTHDQATKTKKPRKINPNAASHANFRSLKIRNKNSKGRRGGGGRFGRR